MASRYKGYQSLAKQLNRAGFRKGGKYCNFPCNGKIANYLFWLFSKKDFHIVYKSDLVDFGIIGENDNLLVVLLTCLRNTRFITWDMNKNLQNHDNSDKFRYLIYASEGVSELMNKEPKEQFVTKKEFDLVKQRLTRVEEVLSCFIDLYDPPVDDKKREFYIQNKEKIKDILKPKTPHVQAVHHIFQDEDEENEFIMNMENDGEYV